jgi:aspartate ammonia-lyase
MTDSRVESDSLGNVDVPADKLLSGQTQRSLEHFSIGHDLMPREMITAYPILKPSAAVANRAGGRLGDRAHRLITRVCDEIRTSKHPAYPDRSGTRWRPAGHRDDHSAHWPIVHFWGRPGRTRGLG